MKKLFSLFAAFLFVGSMWGATTYEQLTSIANIDEEAEYVLGIDGTGFHYEGTSSWGKTALPTAQTPIVYTLKKAQDGNSFTAEATIGDTKYYLQVPTSNTFSMATSTGTNTDLIIGTTQVSGTNYAVANKTTTTRHLRINGTSGLRSYAGTTGNMAFFYKVVNSGPSLVSVAVSEIPNTTTYEEGNVFDIDGLVVTGTYSAGDPAVISEGITWKARTNSTSDDEVALENYHLTAGQTSLQVQATVSAIASEWYTVSGLTVNEHVVTPGTYDLTLANAFWGTSGTGANAGHTASGTQNDITVSINGNSGTQNYINDTETRIYGSHTLTFSVPSGYELTEITGLGTESKSDIEVASGSTGTITTRVWNGTAQSVTFQVNNRTDFTTVSVTYAEPDPTVSADPDTVNVLYTGAKDQTVTLTYSNWGTETYIADPALFSDEEGKSPVTPSWISNLAIDETDYETVTFDVAANTGDERTVYLKVSVLGDNNSTDSVIVPIIQAPAPVDPTISFRDSTLDIGYTLDLSELFTSNSEGAVTYSITAGGSYATLNGKILTGVDVGNVTVQASQAAAAGYNAGSRSNTIKVQEHVVKAGTYTIDPLGTEFWGCEAINKSNATEDEINFTGTQDDVTVTIKNGKKANAWIGASQTRVYADGYTMKFEAPTGFSLTAISFTAGDNTWAGSHTADVGTMTDNKNWAGTAESVTITFAGTCRIASVSITYIVTPSVANPSISGETPFLNSSTVTLDCETGGATIYYTLDGEDPDNTATEYTAPFAISETTTIKAIAYKDAAHSDILSMTFTKASAITVAEALELADKTNNVFVAGIVSGIITAYTSENGYASYYISDDGLTTSQLQCYKGIGEGIDVLAVGDKVVVKGDYTTSYGKELKANNTLKSRTALSSVAIDDSEAAKAYEAGDEFELSNVKATATFGDASTLDVTNWATWTPASAPTVTEDGNVNVTASWCGKTGEKSIAVTVNTHTVTFADPANGSLTVRVSGGNISSGAQAYKGETITIVAAPDKGYKIASVTANDEPLVGEDGNYSYNVGTEDVTIVATFSVATGFEDVETSVKAVKVLRDGQIFILRGDKTFNAQGQLVK